MNSRLAIAIASLCIFLPWPPLQMILGYASEGHYTNWTKDALPLMAVQCIGLSYLTYVTVHMVGGIKVSLAHIVCLSGAAMIATQPLGNNPKAALASITSLYFVVAMVVLLVVREKHSKHVAK